MSVPIESPYATSYYWLIAIDIFCVFELPLGGRGARDNVRYSIWAHWKARSGLPISVHWTFFARCYGWVAISEKRLKIGDFAPTRSVWSKISGRRGRHHQSFSKACLTTLPLTVFTQRNFVADFLQGKCDFRRKSAVLRFEPPSGLRATYDGHLRLIAKRVVDFLLVLIELFSLGVTAEELSANIGWKSAILLRRGPVDQKFHQPFFFSEN